MRQFIFRTSRSVLCAAVILTVSGCSAAFQRYWNDLSTRLPEVASPYNGTEMRFLGVSSFLIRDGNSTLMIDGFISRPQATFIRPIQPEIDIVKNRLVQSGIGLAPSCDQDAPAYSKLDTIVALHGHFDHALDTPLIAALTGATLVADAVVDQIADRTKALYPNTCAIRKSIIIEEITTDSQLSAGRTAIRLVPDQHPPNTSSRLMEGASADPKNPNVQISVGTMSLTLVPVRHSSNLASRLLEGAWADPNWRFPTKASNLKVGISLAAHVETRSGSLLIIPTAGQIGSEFADRKLQAKTIFLGIGGLGWGSREDAKRYWENTVVASGARRVVPIHWDSFSPPLEPEPPGLEPPKYERLDRSLVWMQDFAKNDPQIELVSVPTLDPFDPFITLNSGENH